MDNIIKTPEATIILNGGNPLDGCPNDWDEAKDIEQKFNGLNEEFSSPIWKFDCGYKLDYDGPLLRVSSRFYPPKTHYGPTWDGNVTILVLDKEVAKRSFDCKTLDELKAQVEEFIKEVTDKVQSAFI